MALVLDLCLVAQTVEYFAAHHQPHRNAEMSHIVIFKLSLHFLSITPKPTSQSRFPNNLGSDLVPASPSR
jgi:hypothetical protein